MAAFTLDLCTIDCAYVEAMQSSLNDHCDINEEEKKEHEDLVEIMTDIAQIRCSKANENAYIILQKTGCAALYDIQEQSLKYCESKTIPHTEEAITLMTDYSPNTSPGQKLININTNFINAVSVDNLASIEEDAKEIGSTVVEGLELAFIQTFSCGTNMSYTDNMFDPLN